MTHPRSMTGYGRAVCVVDARRFVIEVRSVNHRFLDLKLRLFTGAGDGGLLEQKITQTVRARLDRGAVHVGVQRDATSAVASVHPNLELALAYSQALEKIRATLGIVAPVELALVVAQPGVLGGSSDDDPEALWTALEPALEAALADLVATRTREGERLAADMRARLDAIDRERAAIAALTADAPAHYRQRLEERLQKILPASGGPAFDPQRLAHEVALFADRVDIAEELTRLSAHIAEARRMLGEAKPVGRRLEFLLQEIQRELTTAGNKSQSAEVATRVIEAKAEIERLREQVQNLE